MGAVRLHERKHLKTLRKKPPTPSDLMFKQYGICFIAKIDTQELNDVPHH